MENLLLVSSSAKASEYFTAFFKAAGYTRITLAESGNEARRQLSRMEYTLVLINTPLSDEFGNELSVAAAQGGRGVLLVVKGEIADDVSAKVEDSGVFVIPKPVNRAFLHQALKLVLAARNRFLGLRQENARLQSKIEEIRLVDRAKCILIERCGLSEPDAHRYIEKQAMDRRTTRRIIAEEVLDNRLPE
ncbi:MAG: ANTAR domain-containing response regulator [Candidatus Howiella sp.]